MEQHVNVTFTRATLGAINAETSRPDGRVYFATDSKEWYVQQLDQGEPGSALTKITDLITLATEQERLSIFFPLPRKLYMVEETQMLWYSTSASTWIKLTRDDCIYILDMTNIPAPQGLPRTRSWYVRMTGNLQGIYNYRRYFYTTAEAAQENNPANAVGAWVITGRRVYFEYIENGTVVNVVELTNNVGTVLIPEYSPIKGENEKWFFGPNVGTDEFPASDNIVSVLYVNMETIVSWLDNPALLTTTSKQFVGAINELVGGLAVLENIIEGFEASLGITNSNVSNLSETVTNNFNNLDGRTSTIERDYFGDPAGTGFRQQTIDDLNDRQLISNMVDLTDSNEDHQYPNAPSVWNQIQSALATVPQGGLRIPLKIELESSLPNAATLTEADIGDYWIIQTMDVTGDGKTGKAWINRQGGSPTGDIVIYRVIDQYYAPDGDSLILTPTGQLTVSTAWLAITINAAINAHNVSPSAHQALFDAKLNVNGTAVNSTLWNGMSFTWNPTTGVLNFTT